MRVTPSKDGDGAPRVEPAPTVEPPSDQTRVVPKPTTAEPEQDEQLSRSGQLELGPPPPAEPSPAESPRTEQTRPEQPRTEQLRSEPARPEQSRQDQNQPDQRRQDQQQGQARPGQARPQGRPDQGRPGQARPGQPHVGNPAPGNPAPGQSAPGQPRGGQFGQGQGRPDQHRPGQQPRPGQYRPDQRPGQRTPDQPWPSALRQEPQRQEPQHQDPPTRQNLRPVNQRQHPTPPQQRHDAAHPATVRLAPVKPAEPREEEPEALPGYDEEPEDRLNDTKNTKNTQDDQPKKSRKPLAVVLALVVVAALAGATVYAVNELGGTEAVETKPPAAPVNVQPLVKPISAQGPAPTPQGIRQALAGPAASGALSPLTGSVVDPSAGTVLWQQGDTTPATPASSLKVLTAAAALLELDRTAQLSTKVVQGSEPGTVVVVGGGDPTISATPGSSVYPGAASLDDLVNQVKAKGPVTKVLYDLGRYAGEPMGPQWETADIAGGSVTPIVPFMVDGGRLDPKKVDGARTPTPAQQAADAFAARLGVTAAAGAAPPGAQTVAEVKSAPVEQLVDNMMQISDNVLTEAIARELAIRTGNEPSFAGGVKAVRDVLTKHGFDLTGANFVDGSGLSATNKIPAKLLTDVLTAAAKPSMDDKTAKLRPLLTALPVAGGSGTLAGRYDGAAARGKGWVRAKTGTLTAVNALAGVVVDVDGRVLVFAFMSGNPGNPDTEVRPALDVLAAALRGCGCS
ncbi:D-alanyl-D-alanine carboxypeptidase/D-alanyl-D-alanine-endopeptidase [Lentzea sp. NPDC042327]|uniref:D-alanyl-D-alanine carboxypeptidase/D-alanyl-D-alanine endopeptidase n=1 Tax=Lentzea sp. NPDC042327 TaxID=3154801 RepID=UPI0034016D51